MKKNFGILTIIFSLAFNIAFIGSYAYHEAKSCLFLFTPPHEGRISPLYEDLDLSHDQLDKLEPLRDNFHAFVREQGEKIKVRQIELVGLLSNEKPDSLAIRAKQKEIQNLQSQMQGRVIDHLLEESGIFTPAQRRKFFAIIKRQIKNSDGQRPRWMPQTQANTSKERCR